MATDDSTPRWSNEDRELVRTASELLKAGEYERLAELLDRVRSSSDRERDPIAAHTLDLARRISLACSQSQAEAEWHQQACKEAAQRQDELRHQLDSLLHLDGAGEESAAAPDLSALEGRPGIVQRLQGLIRRRPDPQPPERVVQEAAAPTVEEPQKPSAAVLPVDAEENADPAPPSLVVYCLGQFKVYQDEQPVEDWPSGKGKAILKYLVTHRERPVVKEVLMELFWPGAHPDAARNNLNVAIYGLRQALRAARPDFSHILFQDDHYLLNPSMAVWVDAEEFLEHCERGRKLEKEKGASPAVAEYEAAEGLYQGDFLEEDLYEDWPMLQREGLRDSYLLILDRLSRHRFEEAEYATCIHLCQKILAKDDCREDAHRRLMRCYCRQGQPYLALRQYHQCAETLETELEVPPMAETLALYERIRAGAAV